MGCLPNQLTGAMSLANDEFRARYEKEWNVVLNPQAGDTQTRTFDRLEMGDLKALYIIGENPLLADVNMNHTKKLFEKLDLLVVQDSKNGRCCIASAVLGRGGWYLYQHGSKSTKGP
jgi:formate dehydrogenase alpha subunit